MAPSQTEVKRSSFPKDFIFGGATSAYQVEGAWNVGGKGWSNWDHMTEHEPDSIADHSNGKVAIDHYNKFEQDVALMKQVGLDSYRFSISWSRILPGGRLCDGISKEGIQFYNDLIDTLLQEGIEPCATIFHWDVPQNLEKEYGGFLNHQIVEHFCEFAEICFWEFGDRVKYWITLNEPWSFTFCGYVIARFPPRRGYPLATSLERVLRSSILHHRSAITLRPVTSSKGYMASPVTSSKGYSARTVLSTIDYAPRSEGYMARDVLPPSEGYMDRELVGTAYNLPSSEGDPIRELVDMAYNLADVASPEGDAVREVVAQAYNLPYIKSSEDGAMAYDYSYGTSSEGYQVRDVDSQRYILRTIISSKGDSVAQDLPSLTSSKGERVRVSSVAHNLHHLTSSKGDRVRVSSMTHVPRLTSSKGHPGTEPYIVAHNLILAHAHAVNIYRKYYQEHQQGKIGMTNVSIWYYPLKEDNQEDIEAASRAIDFLLGWFVAPVITGDYPPSMRNNVGKRLPKFKPDEVALVKGSCDFLGINYYTARYAQNVPREISITHYQNDQHFVEHTYRNGKPIGERGGSEWLYIVPEGIYNMMLYIKDRYNNPEIFITENGVDELRNDALPILQAVSDETRVNYFKDHLEYLRKAMEHGVRLKGYFIWSFFDNFEWTSGYNVRFGVCHVDFRNGLERNPKSSAQWWMDFLNENESKDVKS